MARNATNPHYLGLGRVRRVIKSCLLTVADGGHGHDGPPQSLGNALEVVVRIGLQPLGVVDETGEEHDAEHEEEDEQEQLLGTRSESVYQYLQSSRVACQLEQTENADDGEKVEDVCIGQLSGSGQTLQNQVGIEGERGDRVDHVDGVTRKVELRWRYLRGNEGTNQKRMAPQVASTKQTQTTLAVSFK